jgi:predicted nucleotidyltransferase
MEAAELERVTMEADAAIAAARGRLVEAVRRASAEGMTQREIARRSNRSQAEINRLLRFHGTTPHARRLRGRRVELTDLLGRRGLTNVRVFGSVAAGADHESSDIDLLVTATHPLGLLAQASVEIEATDLLGIPVDLVFDDAIRPDLRTRILATAVPL